MASLEDVWDAIKAELNAALANSLVSIAGAQPTAVNFVVRKDNPTQEIITALPRSSTLASVSLFDSMTSRDTSRWVGAPWHVDQVGTCGISTEMQDNTIQISGLANAADAVVVVFRRGINERAITYYPSAGATPTTMAVGLGVAIASDPVLNHWVSSSANQGVLTISSTQINSTITFGVQCSNIGTSMVGEGQMERGTQISLFTGKHEIRRFGSTAIISKLMQLQRNNGLRLADGTWARIKFRGEKSLPTKQNEVFQWICMFDAEIAITSTEPLYPVLGIVNNSLPFSDEYTLDSSNYAEISIAQVPYASPFAVLLGGSWNSNFYSPLLGETGFFAFSNTRPNTPKAIYFTALPIDYPGLSVIPVEAGSRTVDVGVGNALVASTNWNTTVWLDSVSQQGNVTLAFQNDAPVDAFVVVYRGLDAYRTPVNSLSLRAELPIKLQEGQMAYALPTWNTTISYQKWRDGSLHAYFDAFPPENSGHYVNWVIAPAN